MSVSLSLSLSLSLSISLSYTHTHSHTHTHTHTHTHAHSPITQNGTLNVMYSTPSMYTKYINEEATNIKWTVKTDDFFPYGEGPWNFLTGKKL